MLHEQPILATIVESAAIYTTWTIFFFATYQARSNVQYPAVDMWPQMSGIAFMLINVRVGLGWAMNGGSGVSGQSVSYGHHSTGRVTNHPQWNQYVGRGLTFKRENSVERMGMSNVGRSGRPLEVNVVQVTSTDQTDDSDKVPPFASYEAHADHV
jgi:hypothetical protein